MIDSFSAPSILVRGNHDTGAGWSQGVHLIPGVARSGVSTSMRLAGGGEIEVLPLGWSGTPGAVARRDEGAAWRDVLGGRARRAIRGGAGRPFIVISHAPPLDAGDAPDPYHRGFRAYRWLLDRTRPVLWLHGHTPLASVPWQVTCGTTMLVNVTGAVLVELVASVPPRTTEA